MSHQKVVSLSFHLNGGWLCLHPMKCGTGFHPVPAPVNGSKWGEPWLRKILRVSDGWGLSSKQNIYTTLSKVQRVLWKRTQVCKNQKLLLNGCEMPSSKLNTTSAIKNSQQLRLPALSCHKNGPINNQSCTREGLMGTYPYCWAFGYCSWEMGESCLQVCSNCWVYQAPNSHTQVTLTKLSS